MTKPKLTIRLIAELNPTTAEWIKPSPIDLGHELSVPFAAVWPRSGTLRNGKAYERLTLVPRTAAKGSSSSRTRTNSPASKAAPQADSLFDFDDLEEEPQPAAPDAEAVMLPTPQANLADNGGSQPPEKRRAGGHSVSLEDAVEHDEDLLPTPRAGHGMDHPLRPNAKDASRLEDAVARELFPTPSVSNISGNHTNNRGEPLLPGAAEDVELLPSPTVALADGGQKSRSGDRKGEALLGGIAEELLPTPTTEPNTGNGHARDLGSEVRDLLPTPLGSDGEKGGPNQRGGKGDLRLSSVNALFPTPVVADADSTRNSTAARSNPNPGHQGDTLLDAVDKLLPTPNTMEHLPVREGEALERSRRRGDPNGSLRTDTANLRERVVEIPVDDVEVLLPTPMTTDAKQMGPADEARKSVQLRSIGTLLPTPSASQHNDSESAEQWQARADSIKAKGINGNGAGTPLPIAVQVMGDDTPADLTSDGESVRWGKYRAAIMRAQAVAQRVAPSPTKADGKGGKRRLAARFVEWMMLLPYGWVTDVPGLSRRDMLKMLGNGVVPAQAAHATALLLDRVRAALADRAA